VSNQTSHTQQKTMLQIPGTPESCPTSKSVVNQTNKKKIKKRCVVTNTNKDYIQVINKQ
jgi:hypothetical protein